LLLLLLLLVLLLLLLVGWGQLAVSHSRQQRRGRCADDLPATAAARVTAPRENNPCCAAVPAARPVQAMGRSMRHWCV
jgi:hypothetical protein